jgi:hypothetical protein
MVMNAEAREFWVEDARMYATVLLRSKACDYTMSLAKQPNEPDFLIEGDRLTPRICMKLGRSCSTVR